ncbi:MAG TPA: succinyl-diaminopimelate desuccinylase [Stellaceae bacterium]|jgi:succinyl-diaminopimelate desuccinylase|nr:succinyl-diaminopimelate desuccinylase [Stellaceae bacterium]
MTLDPVELAAALIKRPSVTPKDEGAIPLLAKTLEGLGFACDIVEFTEQGTAPILNLYARRGSTAPNFCFAGHTDVVPPGDLKSWSVDPFGGQVLEGSLYGRGASDMKGAIACFVAAVSRFLEAHRDFDRSISLLITGDEEAAAINGTKKLLDWAAKRGERFDLCIVGEPTSAKKLGDMVKIGRRGSLNGFLTVTGIQGHTANPHLADNAAHRLLKMLSGLLAEPIDRGNERFPPTDLQISTIDIGNPTTNVIPGEARAVFNIRYNDQWTSKTLEAWLRQKLDAAGGRYKLAIQVSGESFLTPPGTVSDMLTRAIGQVTGLTPELSTTGGTSDARFIHHYCPVAEFGLVGLTMHKVDERAPVADLAALTEIYRAALELYFAKR